MCPTVILKSLTSRPPHHVLLRTRASRSSIAAAGLASIIFLSYHETMAQVVNTPDYWWCNSSTFEPVVLSHSVLTWDAVGKDLEANGIVVGSIGNVRYWLLVGLSGLHSDASASAPVDHRNLAAGVVAA